MCDKGQPPPPPLHFIKPVCIIDYMYLKKLGGVGGQKTANMMHSSEFYKLGPRF